MRKNWTVLAILIVTACEGGLEPVPPVEPGFSGTVRFAANTWPPLDSLVSLWVFASQIYPLDSTSVFKGLFDSPQRIFIYPTDRPRLALNVDSVAYIFPVPPAAYRYIGVIQQLRSDLSIRSFRVVGFYHDGSPTSQQLSIIVHEGEIVARVDMFVDFHNPPAQPF